MQPSPFGGTRKYESSGRERRGHIRKVAKTRTRRPDEGSHEAPPEAGGHREDWNAEEHGAKPNLSLVGKHAVHRLVLDKV